LASGKFGPDGDKAVKVIYEVVMKEGVGSRTRRREVLPLDKDLAARVKQVKDQYAHSMEIFGDV